MLYFILIILSLTLFLYYIYKDYLKVLKISSIITCVSGFFTFLVGYILRYLVNMEVTFINISKVTDIIFIKFLKNSLYLFLLSFIEIIIYGLVKYYYLKKKEVRV